MPKLQLSHDKLVRIANALLADTARRHALSFPRPGVVADDVSVHREVARENDAILRQINAARLRDGLGHISGRTLHWGE